MNLRELIKTLQIIVPFSYCQAEHDILYLPLVNNADISKEDKEELLSLGAFESDADCWAVYT